MHENPAATEREQEEAFEGRQQEEDAKTGQGFETDDEPSGALDDA